MSAQYGWIAPKPNKRERFIRWILRQPYTKHDFTLTFPVITHLEPGMKIRMGSPQPKAKK